MTDDNTTNADDAPMRKRCPKCSRELTRSDFYRNVNKKDGLQCWCKECWKSDAAARKLRDPDHNRKLKRESAARRYPFKRPTRWLSRPYDEKQIARRRLQKAVANGTIVRQSCRVCAKSNAQAHHVDYSRPLDVEWLCALCHAAEHRRIEQRL